MTTEEQLINITKSARAIRNALSVLEAAGLDARVCIFEFRELLEKAETYIPAGYPEAYRIRSVPLSITEHLTEDRDMTCANLHSPSSNGRIYTLTKGQRAVLRERYGMTPTKEVVVTEIAVWPAAPTCVQHILVRSTEHVPDSRHHVLNAATITDWVAFCTAARAIDEAEVDVDEDTPRTKKQQSAAAERQRFQDLLSQYT